MFYLSVLKPNRSSWAYPPKTAYAEYIFCIVRKVTNFRATAVVWRIPAIYQTMARKIVIRPFYNFPSKASSKFHNISSTSEMPLGIHITKVLWNQMNLEKARFVWPSKTNDLHGFRKRGVFQIGFKIEVPEHASNLGAGLFYLSRTKTLMKKYLKSGTLYKLKKIWKRLLSFITLPTWNKTP